MGGRQLGAARLGGDPPVSNLADRAEVTAKRAGRRRLPRRRQRVPAADLFDDELETDAIEARGYWAGVWLRLRRDRLALAGGFFIVLLFLVAF